MSVGLAHKALVVLALCSEPMVLQVVESFLVKYRISEFLVSVEGHEKDIFCNVSYKFKSITKNSR